MDLSHRDDSPTSALRSRMRTSTYLAGEGTETPKKMQCLNTRTVYHGYILDMFMDSIIHIYIYIYNRYIFIYAYNTYIYIYYTTYIFIYTLHIYYIYNTCINIYYTYTYIYIYIYILYICIYCIYIYMYTHIVGYKIGIYHYIMILYHFMSIDIGFNGYLLRVLPNWQQVTTRFR